MAQPPSKRRRVDAAATLSKPFKSPMRRPVPTTTAASPATPVATRALNDAPAQASTPVSNIPTHSLPAEQKATSRPLSTPTRFHSSDPDILALQKQQRAIQSRIASLRTDLDAATQAHQLESSTKDTELEALIVKWRHISQDAADEAFVGAQERVNKMGGMKAWKERSKRDATRWEEYEEEKREIEHVDEEEEEYRDLGGLSEMLQSRKIVHEQGREESSDEEFSMGYMLKTLHIDPKLIGYDVVAQTWIKG